MDTYTNLNYDFKQAENKTIDYENDSDNLTNRFIKHFHKDRRYWGAGGTPTL